MSRFKLTIEFVGTRYSGWQIQKNARTVQGEIHDALRKVAGRSDFELYGSGRTDAGVHALGQVAHLDLQTSSEPEGLRRDLNDELPADIHILALEPAPARFHARHQAIGRSYLYQISRRRTAFGKLFVWWIRDPLNLSAMRQAAERFVGFNDYRSFAAGDPDEARVLLDAFEVAEAGDLVLFRVRGSHFLWKMVRRMVGVVAGVGRGKLSVADVERFLQKGSSVPAELTAPPSGLFLERVFYEGDATEWALEPAVAISGLSQRGVAAPSRPGLSAGRRSAPSRPPKRVGGPTRRGREPRRS